MLNNLAHKVQLAELLPAPSAARAQAMLALAAQKTNKSELAHWLTRRAELLVDINEMTTHRPILKDVWK